MGLGDCTKCIKYLLFVFNVIFCLIGLTILAVGIVLYVSPNIVNDIVNVEHIRIVLQGSAITIIVLGSIVTILGFLGCCGAIFENRVLLVLFFILLLLVFLVFLAAGIVFTVFTGQYYDKHTVRQFFADAHGKPANSSEGMAVDGYQRLFVCCGWKEEDNAAGPSNTPPPPSFCHLNHTATDVTSCSQRIDAAERHRVPVIAALFITAAISFFGAIFSIVLCCAISDLA